MPRFVIASKPDGARLRCSNSSRGVSGVRLGDTGEIEKRDTFFSNSEANHKALNST